VAAEQSYRIHTMVWQCGRTSQPCPLATAQVNLQQMGRQ
jgi:hypothetical protein